MSAFNRIREGLEQAIAHTQGQPIDVMLHRPSKPDVKTIRLQTGLTQEQFAMRCHISVNTLRHWERGDRQPHGAAAALLRLVAHDSQFVMNALAKI